jgi:hypothetical protein
MVHRVVRRYMYSSKFVSLQLAKRNVRFQDGRLQALTTELGAPRPPRERLGLVPVPRLAASRITCEHR